MAITVWHTPIAIYKLPSAVPSLHVIILGRASQAEIDYSGSGWERPFVPLVHDLDLCAVSFPLIAA
jgi:hypothetical protein